MSKKIAIIVRERQHEALRMAVGAALADDEISVFVLDKKLVSDAEIDLNVETLSDFDIKVYSNVPENSNFEQKTTEEIAGMLPEYDLVISY